MWLTKGLKTLEGSKSDPQVSDLVKRAFCVVINLNLLPSVSILPLKQKLSAALSKTFTTILPLCFEWVLARQADRYRWPVGWQDKVV